MAISRCPSIITLKVNGINVPVERHRVTERIKKNNIYKETKNRTHLYAAHRRRRSKDECTEREQMGKAVPCKL